jgi:SNF2 family DNA or RNA helicase
MTNDVYYDPSDNEEIKRLADTLRAMRAEVESITAALEPIKEVIAEVDAKKSAAYKEYLAVIAGIVEKETEYKGKRNEMNNSLRQVTKNVESVERQLQQAMRLERIAAEAEKVNKQLDDAMMLAKWFGQILKHQFEAAKKITFNQRIILADAPGLGKTLTSLATADLIKEATANASPTNPYGYDADNKIMGTPHQCGRKILYVCPAPLLNNVVREVRLWTDRAPVLMGNQPKATRRFLIEVLNDSEDFIVVINYEAWRRDRSLLEDLMNLQFDFVILDEAHMLKDRKTGAYKAIRELILNHEKPEIDVEEYNRDVENGRGYTWNKVSNSATPFILCMTGTPILNKPQDLYSLLSLVDPDHFTSENWFLRDYCEQDYYSKKWGFRPGGLDSLAKRISNLYIRRTKRDAGIILPGKHEEIHEIEVDEENYPLQAKARKEMRTYGAILMSAEKTITAAAEIAIYTRLRQIETWPAGIEIKDENHVVQLKLDVEESQKLDYLFDKEENGLLADLSEGGLKEGQSTVVFSQFKAPLRELHRRLSAAGISAVVLDGDTPDVLRDAIIKDFDRRHTNDNDAKWQVCLANYRVGGVGVTLTRATEVILLDSEWSGGREEQAMDRVHRIGQTEDVTIHKIIMDKTIDKWLEGIVTHKKAMTDGFNQHMDFSELRKHLLEDN